MSIRATKYHVRYSRSIMAGLSGVNNTTKATNTAQHPQKRSVNENEFRYQNSKTSETIIGSRQIHNGQRKRGNSYNTHTRHIGEEEADNKLKKFVSE